MSNIVAHNGVLPPAPARAQQRMKAGQGRTNNFATGVRESFPTISFKGSRWAFKFQGQTHPMLLNGYPAPYLDVVLVNASPAISKVFYEVGYAEGDMKPPDCWSVNGVRPDPASPKAQSVTCAGCKQNAFGSRVTPAGKMAKACQDSRRVAAAFPHDLLAQQVGPIMLRVPQSSLKNLKEYAQMLAHAGYEPNACITRMAFDPAESYPKLTFTFHAPLTDADYDAVCDMENAEITKRILEAPVEGAASEELDDEGQAAIAQAGAGYAAAPPAQPAPPPYQPPQQPAYQPPQQPAYQPPQQPAYQPPQAAYAPPQAHVQPTYQPPAQPAYQPPQQPAYAPPAQPAYQPPPQQVAPPAYQPPQQPTGLPPGITIPPGAPQPTARPTRTRTRPAAAPQPEQAQAAQPTPGPGFAPQNGATPGPGFAPVTEQAQPTPQAAQTTVAQAPPNLEAVLAGLLPGAAAR